MQVAAFANQGISVRGLIHEAMKSAFPVYQKTAWHAAPSVRIPTGVYPVWPGDLTPPVQFLYRWTLDLGGSWLIMNDTTGSPLLDNTDMMVNCTIQNGVIVGTTGKELAIRNKSDHGVTAGMRFINLEFHNLSAFSFEGSVVTSEMTLQDIAIGLNAPGQIGLNFDNVQSVDHWIERLRMTVSEGTVGINVLGGGMMNIRNVDLECTGGTFLQIGPNTASPPKLGWLNDGYFIEGVKSEFLSATGMLVNNTAGSNVHFSRSNFGMVAAGQGKSRVSGKCVFDSTCLNLGSIGASS